MNIHDAALAWHDAGACVLPAAADGSKRPALAWDRYKTQRPQRDECDTWSTASSGIGIVCGSVSGNIEMFEAEAAAVEDGMHSQLMEMLPPDLRNKLNTYVERSPKGGCHWIFRVDGTPVKGNTKLARRAVRKPGEQTVTVLFETRGEGGWTVIAPSNGPTHPTGRPWQIVYGSPGVIPLLTADEYRLLHACAATFDQMPQRTEVATRHTAPAGASDKNVGAPGHDFNAKATWDEILIPAGWTKMRTRGEITDWCRPGKNPRDGGSATTGCHGDWFYVFTTGTQFDSETTYSKFKTYAILNHGGDVSTAARDLRQRGYGAPRQPPTRPLELVHSTNTVTDENTEQAQADDTPPISLTDAGNAQRFVTAHAHHLRYVPERGHWLTWDNTRWAWAPDEAPALQAMLATIQAINPGDDQALYKYQQRSLNYRPLQNAIALARSNPAIRAPLNRLDADPYALNTPTGVVDLRTGRITPGRPEQLHTRTTSVPYDPEATAPRWQRFLADTFDGDQELINFVQRLSGYSAVGKVTHHVLPFLHGSGGNGKTVLLDVHLTLLGDYATTAPADFLLAGGREDEAAVARLAGQRMVVCSEVNQTARFNEAKIKLLTGGDKITARFLYHEHFTFTPTHQLWLMANHQPRVDAGGEGFWRRLRLVPFLRTVPSEQRIEGLADALATEEGPGILRWIVDGARMALTDGLAEPAAVLAATAQYAEEEDALGRFVEERCHLGGGHLVRVETRELRSAYEQWCFLEGEKPISPQMFGRELRGRWGIGQTKSNGHKFYAGVTLLQVDSSESEQSETEWWQK